MMAARMSIIVVGTEPVAIFLNPEPMTYKVV